MEWLSQPRTQDITIFYILSSADAQGASLLYFNFSIRVYTLWRKPSSN